MQLKLDRGMLSIVNISPADEIYLEHLNICKSGDIINFIYNKSAGNRILHSIPQSEANNIKEKDIMGRLSKEMDNKPLNIDAIWE
jgi:hypothetical protein